MRESAQRFQFCIRPSRAGLIKRATLGVVGLCWLTFATLLPAGEPFLRGDCNVDSTIDLGDPIFLLSYLFSSGQNPACAAACDFNGDGTLDIADAIYLESYLFLSGTAPPEPFPTCATGESPLGCVEYSASCPESPLFAPGVRLEPSSGGEPLRSVDIGDIDGDGTLDIVVGGNTSLFKYLGMGDGSFGAATPIEVVGAEVLALDLGDIDADGVLDLVTPHGVALGVGGGSFAPLDPGIVGGSVQALADLNGDGAPDIVVAQASPSGLRVRLSNGSGGFGPATVIAAAGIGFGLGLATGDVNGDGALDVVSGSNAVVWTFLNDGTGTLLPPVSSPWPGRFATLGDLNHDGLTDLTLIRDDGTLRGYPGSGDGLFPAELSAGSSHPFLLETVLGDLDLDGNLDALSAAWFDYAVGHLGNGDGTFAAGSVVPIPLEPSSDIEYGVDLALGDFDGDGDLDAVVACVTFLGSGRLIVFENCTN